MKITEKQIMTTWNIYTIGHNRDQHIIAYYTDDYIDDQTKQEYHNKYSNIDFGHATSEYAPEISRQVILRKTR